MHSFHPENPSMEWSEIMSFSIAARISRAVRAFRSEPPGIAASSTADMLSAVVEFFRTRDSELGEIYVLDGVHLELRDSSGDTFVEFRSNRKTVVEMVECLTGLRIREAIGDFNGVQHFRTIRKNDGSWSRPRKIMYSNRAG